MANINQYNKSTAVNHAEKSVRTRNINLMVSEPIKKRLHCFEIHLSMYSNYRYIFLFVDKCFYKWDYYLLKCTTICIILNLHIYRLFDVM